MNTVLNATTDSFRPELIRRECLAILIVQFMFQNALALTKGIQPMQLTQKAALVIREYVTKKIIKTSRKPKAQTTICDMLDCQKPIKDAWVQCEVCGRWLHFKCIGLNKVPRNDYVCIVCESQYR